MFTVQAYFNASLKYLNHERTFKDQIVIRVKVIVLPLFEALACLDNTVRLTLSVLKCTIILITFVRSPSFTKLHSFKLEIFHIAHLAVKATVCFINILVAPLLGVVSPEICRNWHIRCGLIDKAQVIEACELSDPLQPTKQRHVTPQETLVGHVCGGWFVRDSPVEGGDPSAMLTYLHNYLKAHPQQ